MNKLYWLSVKASEIKPGNFVSAMLATTPRLISKVVEEPDGTISLIESLPIHGNHNYMNHIKKDHRLDLLYDETTKNPYSEQNIQEE